MNISLTPKLEKLINEKVKSGLYNSASEVVREGLRLLEEQDQLKKIRREELRKEIQKGIDQMREGKFTTYESAEEMMEDIIKEARAEKEEREKNGL